MPDQANSPAPNHLYYQRVHRGDIAWGVFWAMVQFSVLCFVLSLVITGVLFAFGLVALFDG